ncbi:MAG: hypothetical protein ACPG3T_00330 [Pseudomonadales bacterium]
MTPQIKRYWHREREKLLRQYKNDYAIFDGLPINPNITFNPT